MAYTHHCMVVGNWVKDQDGLNIMEVRNHYPDERFRCRAQTPPGGPQDTSNLIPDPAMDSFYVQGSWALLQQLAADPDYPIIQEIEPIPQLEVL